jgi:hypothetical protein
MTAAASIDLTGGPSSWPKRGPDLLRDVVAGFVQALMSAEADAVCGAETERWVGPAGGGRDG